MDEDYEEDCGANSEEQIQNCHNVEDDVLLGDMWDDADYDDGHGEGGGKDIEV